MSETKEIPAVQEAAEYLFGDKEFQGVLVDTLQDYLECLPEHLQVKVMSKEIVEYVTKQVFRRNNE